MVLSGALPLALNLIFLIPTGIICPHIVGI